MRPICVPCAGGIVLNEAGELLLIRRARPPSAGLWSVPGGRCLDGEASADACVREVAEETGLHVRVLRHAGRVERPGLHGATYQIDDYVCSVTGGQLRVGDDAADARWVAMTDLGRLELVPGLLESLAEWGIVARG